MPLFSTSYAGVLYPPNWLYMYFGAGLANWLAVFHTVLGGVGMTLYLRSHRLLAAPALIGAMLFVCGGFMLIHASHVSMREAALFAPWVVWSARRLLRKPGAGHMAALSLLLALQIAIGYMQIVLFTVIWIGVEWLARARPAASFGRQTGALTIAGILGVALMAPQILATRAHVAETLRANLSLQEWQTGSFPLSHFLLLVQPRVFGAGPTWTGGEPMGELLAVAMPLTWILALAGAWLHLTSKRGPRRRIVMLLVIATAACFLLALGRFFAPNDLLFRVPPFNLFRVPARWLFLASAFASILAAYGIQAFIGIAPVRRLAVLAGAFLALLLVTYALSVAGTPALEPIPSPAELLWPGSGGWIHVAAVLIAGTSIFVVRRVPLAVIVVVALLAAAESRSLDEALFPPPGRHEKVLDRSRHPLLHRFSPNGVQRIYSFIPAQGHLSGLLLPHNTAVYSRFHVLQGYSPLYNQRLAHRLGIGQDGRAWYPEQLIAQPNALYALGVTQLLVDPAGWSGETRALLDHRVRSGEWNWIDSAGGVTLLGLPRAAPRFHFARRWHAVPKDSNFGELIRERTGPHREAPVFLNQEDSLSFALEEIGRAHV